MQNIELSRAVSVEVEAIAREASLEDSPRSIGGRLAPVLPDVVHDALIGLRQGSDEGAVCLHGVGPGEVPDSAEEYTQLEAAPLLLGLVSLIATPVAARNEWDGAPLTDIKVTAGLEDTVSSKGKNTLPMHQEDQHLENPPDGLALLTVRGGSPTRLASTTDIVAAFEATADAGMVDKLREPHFRHRMPDSFGGTGMGEPTPILFGSNEMPELSVDLATTEGASEVGELALATLAAATDAVATELELEPGHLLIFDNRRWLHGRGQTLSSSSGRWLLRSLFVFDVGRMHRKSAEGAESELIAFT